MDITCVTVDCPEEDFPPSMASQYRNVILRNVEGNELCLSGGPFPSA